MNMGTSSQLCHSRVPTQQAVLNPRLTFANLDRTGSTDERP